MNVILFGNRIYTDRRESQAIASHSPEGALDEECSCVKLDLNSAHLEARHMTVLRETEKVQCLKAIQEGC